MGEIGSASTPAQTNGYAAAAGASQGIGGMAALGGGIAQARAYGMQGHYQRRLADINARMSQLQATDAVKRGALTAGVLEARGTQIEGRQSVIQAGGGTDVNSGTNAAIRGSTQAMSRIDQLTAENNAALEAIGFRTNAINQTAEGKMAQLTGKFQSSQSILSGGENFAKGVVAGFGIYDKYHIRAPGDPIPSNSGANGEQMKGSPFVNPKSVLSEVDDVKLPGDVA